MRKQSKPTPKQSKTKFIVYDYEKPKNFNGILGSIDVHYFNLLLMGGTAILEEEVPKKVDPVVWYSELLEQQDIYISEGHVDLNGNVWLRIDAEKTPINEFSTWTDLADSQKDDLAFRSFWIPCKAGTTKECLGLWISAKEESIGLPLSNVLEYIMTSTLV